MDKILKELKNNGLFEAEMPILGAISLAYTATIFFQDNRNINIYSMLLFFFCYGSTYQFIFI